MNPEEKLAQFGIRQLPPATPAKGNGADSAGKPPRFPLVKFSDVSMTATAVHLVKGLIPRAGLVVIWGPPKCGKSFWVFDLLLHVALGWQYRGLRVKQGAIVYCALEGGDGFRRRIEAFRREHSDAKDAPFHLMATPLDLIRDHKALIEAIRAQLPPGVTLAAVAIDTLNRSLVGSENKPEDMAAYVQAADTIRDAFDCVVPIIHHCGHDADRPRGHSSLLGAADVQISVKSDDAGDIVATVDFAKDSQSGLQILSRLQAVDVGKDEDGDEMTSCVVVPVGEMAIRKGSQETLRLTNAAKNALRALHMAIDELGEDRASTHIPAGVRAVTVKQWRDHAFRAGISTSEKPHAQSVAFNRGSEALLAANKIGIWEPYVWPMFQENGGK